MPTQKKTMAFYLLRPLGQGIEGMACLACTKSGSTCAVKLFHEQERIQVDQERIEKEIEIWNQVYKVKVFGSTQGKADAM